MMNSYGECDPRERESASSLDRRLWCGWDVVDADGPKSLSIQGHRIWRMCPPIFWHKPINIEHRKIRQFICMWIIDNPFICHTPTGSINRQPSGCSFICCDCPELSFPGIVRIIIAVGWESYDCVTLNGLPLFVSDNLGDMETSNLLKNARIMFWSSVPTKFNPQAEGRRRGRRRRAIEAALKKTKLNQCEFFLVVLVRFILLHLDGMGWTALKNWGVFFCCCCSCWRLSMSLAPFCCCCAGVGLVCWAAGWLSCLCGGEQ